MIRSFKVCWTIFFFDLFINIISHKGKWDIIVRSKNVVPAEEGCTLSLAIQMLLFKCSNVIYNECNCNCIFIHQVAGWKRQKDLSFLESSCHLPIRLPLTGEGIALSLFSRWMSNSKAVNTNFHSIWFDLIVEQDFFRVTSNIFVIKIA